MKLIYTLCIVAALGCHVEKKAPLGPCVKVNDPCEYAPGKLGVCVDENLTGQGAPKLTCQSQH